MRIVLDTNSLLVSIPHKSKYRLIFETLLNGGYILLISNEILSEYAEVIEEKSNTLVSDNVCEFLAQSKYVERVEIYYRWNLIEHDADDNKFVDCAVSGNANYIVTDDRHYRMLKRVQFPSVKVVSTKRFLAILQEI